ncbi:MAG TPA: cob(I)yrinic acid a,c-diamide adenosyltransferase [Coriobacteriia bacterium]
MATIYTKSGDAGATSLPDGTRVGKDDPRIALYGALDEANCLIGLARVSVLDSGLDAALGFIQHRLFNCGACLPGPTTSPNGPRIDAQDVTALEAVIDRYSARLGSWGFTLPGCDEVSARLHVARAVMRRAEREAVRLNSTDTVDPMVLAFLNRASDLLYVAARYTGNGNECAWHPDAERP